VSLAGSVAGYIEPMGARSTYPERARQNAKFFGGGSLADPDSASDIFKQAKKWAKGDAGFKGLGGKKKRKKSKKKRS